MADLEYGTVNQGNEGISQFEFGEKSVRMAFIRKVYSILMLQLAVTCGAICLFIFCQPVKLYAQQNMWFVWTPFAFLIVLLFVLVCFSEVRRRFPLNIILLAAFTLFESWSLGAICAHYETDAVLIAAGITAVVSLSLTIFAFQTKFDFTMCGGFLFVALIILICAGFLCAIVGATSGMHTETRRWLQIVYGSIGALIFSLYIIYDTQLMLGGNHRYSISPEEYIFAALNLYLDIINLFLMILSVVQGARN